MQRTSRSEETKGGQDARVLAQEEGEDRKVETAVLFAQAGWNGFAFVFL